MDTQQRDDSHSHENNGGQTQRKLPKAHYEALSRMVANPDNPLRKLPGGFWVVDPMVVDYQEGEWFASGNAVKVMLQHGLVQHVRNQASAVQLTPVGIDALRTNHYTPILAE